ncbi:MAG: GntR family transcriptional regulator [Alphaproteobacteria bacterium]|nr:MAG: GntR family transcriptional regulator [Alphaproteobacteria bacterium]
MEKTPPETETIIKLDSTIQSQSSKAYDILEGMLVSLELKPGTIFTESEVSKLIGLGRTPVREALLRLALEKLVIAIPRRGFQVTSANVREQLLVLEVRRPLDRFMATRAARRANEEERATFIRIGEGMKRAEEEGEELAFLRLDKEFNELLSIASHNPFARDAIGPLNTLSRRFWMANRTAERGSLIQTIEMHIAIIEAIVKGDETSAWKAADVLTDYNEAFARETVLLDF